MHLCIGGLFINDSDKSLRHVGIEAITWLNADLLSIKPLATNFSEIWM